MSSLQTPNQRKAFMSDLLCELSSKRSHWRYVSCPKLREAKWEAVKSNAYILYLGGHISEKEWTDICVRSSRAELKGWF